MYGNANEVKLTENAKVVLAKRYLKKNEDGTPIEEPHDMFRRVANNIAQADRNYDRHADVHKTEEEFYGLITNLEFLPNSPTLMNAGRDLQQLSACFHPEQLIITKDGPKAIKDIIIGEQVLTHKNRFRKVSEKFERQADSLYTFGVYKLPTQTMKVTGEHPILAVRKNGDNVRWLKASELHVGDYVALNFPQKSVDRQTIKVSEYLTGRDLVEVEGYLYEKNTDLARCPEISRQLRPVKNEIAIDASLLRLFGYYFSEGCVSGEDCVRFTFSNEEEAYAQDVINLMKGKFGIGSRIEAPSDLSRQWISLRFHSRILAEFFLKLFNTGYAAKTIPDWFIYLPAEKQKGFLAGLFRGDSCVFKNGNNFSTKLVMCNTQAVFAAWQMLMRLGHFAALNFDSMPKMGHVRPVKCQVSGRDGCQIIAELLETEIPHNGFEFTRTIKKEGTLFSPIDYIEKQDYQGSVYNLEVEEDHTYSANFVSVHNCFVLPIEDTMEGIFETLKNTSLIHKSGGGTGFSFSRLRAKGAWVKSTHGVASGPISFLKVFDAATQAVIQGGTRRGANMGILRVDHPDIMDFITCKQDDKSINNFNISVAVTDDFMKKLSNNEDYNLIDPHTSNPVKSLNTKDVFDLIVKQAHKNGEPGIIFIDRMNQFNPTPKLGAYESTNPCGEQVLLPYESCNLGSINLAKMIVEKDAKSQVDWDRFAKATRLAVHFLDNVIEMNRYPVKKIEQMTKANRKIGLGVMGFADMLMELGIPYNSEDAVVLAEKLMKFMLDEAAKASLELARKRGAFANFKDSIYAGGTPIRNATLTTIAPTGTLSIIAACSSGIEPVFSICYYRKVLDGQKLVEVNPAFEKIARARGFYSEELMKKISQSSSLRGIEEIPQDVRKVFVTAHDITPIWHIRMQAAFQKHTHNAVSKTVNFAHNATIEDVKEAYMLAHKLGCKGVTIYRDMSRQEQVLNIERVSQPEAAREKMEKQPISNEPQGKPPNQEKIAPRPRPKVVRGTTTKIQTGCGNLYVTINIDEQGKPFEVFTQMGKAGGCAASQLEAVGRLVSLALRTGIDIRSIIDQLQGIRCPSPSWEKGGRIFSCADAIGKVIERVLLDKKLPPENSSEPQLHIEVHKDDFYGLGKGTNGVGEDLAGPMAQSKSAVKSRISDVVGVCPDCGEALHYQEGCMICRGCGHTKCG